MFDSQTSWKSCDSQSSWRSSSSPAQMRRSASGTRNTQAQLLRQRGDLEQGRGRFCVQLPKVRPIVRSNPDGPSFSRIGMSLARDSSKSGLVVLQADHGLQKKTPVAQLNKEEERQAERDEAEVHASYAIRPGDRIREVHAEGLDKTLENLGQCHAQQDDEPGMNKETMSASAMLAQLDIATSETSPRVVNLSISRNLENVFMPCTALDDSRPPSRTSSRPPSRASLQGSAQSSPLGKHHRSSSLSSLSTASSNPGTPPRRHVKLRDDGRTHVAPPVRTKVLATMRAC